MGDVKDYLDLVRERRECRRCSGLTNPSEVLGGSLDSQQIGPWSTWQGNLSSDLLVVGQDWGDVSYFENNEGRDSARNPTNDHLIALLSSIGISIGPPGGGQGQHVVFFTNAILCLKSGGLQSRVEDEWFRNCAGFLRRQIEIVAPRVVVTLGARAFRAVLSAFDLRPQELWNSPGFVDTPQPIAEALSNASGLTSPRWL